MHFRPWLLCLDVSELAARLAPSPLLADGPGDDEDDEDEDEGDRGDDGSIDPEVDEGGDEDEDTLWARAGHPPHRELMPPPHGSAGKLR
jgi:hypothetical protein